MINISNSLLDNLEIKYNSAILFGSYARNDYGQKSDIDILLECDKRKESFNSGIINFTIYTKHQLKKMASKGSLFILHIIEEGKEITDTNLLSELKSSFSKPISYTSYRKELVNASDLLDVSESDFVKYKVNLNRFLYYLARSFLYALAIDKNCKSFSIKEVCAFLNLENYLEFFENKNLNSNFNEYNKNLTYISTLLERRPCNKYKSIELLLVNSLKSKYLLRIFGLRLLNEKNELIEYENLIQE
jgi:predicted nucleotidyltransferase